MANFTGSDLGVLVRNEVAPPTGSTTALVSPYNWLLFTNPGTIAAQTVTLPANPVDGQWILISNFAIITALTFSPAVTGFTNASALAAGNGIWVAWSASQNVWFALNQ